MSQKEIIKYLIANNISVPLVQIILSMLIALALSLCVYQVYRITYTGVMYSRDFNITVMMIALITTLVILIIGSNLALSLGMVGALSIIRFRTAVKDARDAGFLFWSIGIGLACGTGSYSIGIVGSLAIGIMLLFVSRFRGFEEQTYLLVIQEAQLDLAAIETILKRETRRYRLRMTNQGPDSEEVTYEVVLKKGSNTLVPALKAEDGFSHFHLISWKGELTGE